MDHPQPTEQSIRRWERARRPMGLVPITATDHFPLAGNNPRKRPVLKRWLDVRLPATP